MKHLWRSDDRHEQFPGVPAWGAPTSRIAPPEFPVAGLGEVTPDWAWLVAADTLVVDPTITVPVNGVTAEVSPSTTGRPRGWESIVTGTVRGYSRRVTVLT